MLRGLTPRPPPPLSVNIHSAIRDVGSRIQDPRYQDPSKSSTPITPSASHFNFVETKQWVAFQIFQCMKRFKYFSGPKSLFLQMYHAFSILFPEIVKCITRFACFWHLVSLASGIGIARQTDGLLTQGLAPPLPPSQASVNGE